MDDVLRRVQDFYEQHPYPEPATDLDDYRDGRMIPRGAPSSCFHYYWPRSEKRDDLEILVAGCGTSQAIEFALYEPGARIVATDIARRSLDHTDWLAKKYGVTNVEIVQLPIEKTPTLGREFDLVICTGVLHHLDDPDEGLRSLRRVLRRDGSMLVMVYGKHGRAGIEMIQAYSGLLSVGRSEQEVSDLRETLTQLPGDHPLQRAMRLFHDYRKHGGLVDMLLHPRDRSYSVPEIYNWLAGTGMRFQRWLYRAYYLPQCCPLRITPHFSRLSTLPQRDQYAAVELFRAHLHNHFLIACRDDRSESSAAVCVTADACGKLVPTVLPFVGGRAAAGGAGATVELANPAHEYSVSSPRLGPVDLAMFRLIDGHRSLADIVAETDAEHERAAELFRMLDDFDLVMLRIEKLVTS